MNENVFVTGIAPEQSHSYDAALYSPNSGQPL